MSGFRAVIYCRCSTEEESQKDALKKQVTEAKECVAAQGWRLVDTYVESVSGTSTKGRAEYNRLFDDLATNKFDVVVIKSQDRLMRNTKDWYLFLDQMTRNAKRLYLYIERKFYSADDALISGIKAILAEDYSRELSKKINNAHKNRQSHGGKPILTGNVYGLRKTIDGSYEVIPEEAAVKVRMYELFAAGYGSRSVANILKNEGIVNRKGVPFTPANIRRMIQNPLNKGIVVMNRRHFDFDTKKIYDVPESEQYVYPGMVPAVVSDELWQKANEQIQKRSVKKNSSDKRMRGKNPGRYLFSGKIFCGVCGSPYYRRVRRAYKDQQPIYEWKCREYLETGRKGGELSRPQIRKVPLEEYTGCNNVHLNESELLSFLEEVFESRYRIDKEIIIEKMIDVLNSVLQENDSQSEIAAEQQRSEKIREQLNVLLDKLLEGIISDDIYKEKQKQLQSRLDDSLKKVRELEVQREKECTLKERILHIKATLKEQHLLEKATVAGMLDEITKIVIYPKHMEICFSFAKMLNLSETQLFSEDEEEILRIEYGNRFNPCARQREKYKDVFEYIKEHPDTTARKVAEVMNLSLSAMQKRFERLKKEGKIRFVGSGGKGYWEVLEK